MHSVVKFGITSGSQKSIDFLNSLDESPNPKIFTTPFVQTLLDHKWDELKWMMYTQAIVYTIYMLILSLYVLFFIGQEAPLILIFSISMLLSGYEVYQFSVDPFDYVQDP
jgi:hypothetical protein